MDIDALRQLMHNTPRTSLGYAPPVQVAVGRYARRRREDGAFWGEIEAEVGVSSKSMRIWMNALQPGGFHQVVVVDPGEDAFIEAVESPLVITSPSGFILTGCTLDQAAAILLQIR